MSPLKQTVCDLFWPRLSSDPVASVTGKQKATAPAFYMRGSSETWLMSGLGLFSLMIYVLTLSRGVDPGVSATSVSMVLHLCADAPVNHPLWLLMSRIVAVFPVFDAVFRLNLFSALCGSLAVAWLFRVAKRILFELVRETPSLAMVPVADEGAAGQFSDSSAMASEQIESREADVAEHLISAVGAIGTALAFGFSAPFWTASTSLHTYPFTILLALITADRLACYHFTGKTEACAMTVFLLGLGTVESVVFVVLLPIALFFLVRAGIRYGHFCEAFLLSLLATGLLGMASNLAVLMGVFDGGHSIATVLSGLAHLHGAEFMRSLPSKTRIAVFLLTVSPLLVGFVSVLHHSDQQNEITRWKWGVLNVIFTALAVACLLNLPETFWSAAREESQLSMISSLAVALAIGCFFAFWCLMASVPAYNALSEHDRPSVWVHVFSYAICGTLGMASLSSLSTNLNDANGRNTGFADCIADEIMAQAGPARYLIADETLGLNLRIRNHLTGRGLVILPVETDPESCEALFRVTSSSSGRMPLSPSALRALPLRDSVGQWLHAHPEAFAQLAVVSSPELWLHMGFTPVPGGLLYIGAAEKTQLSGPALLARHQALCRRLAPSLAESRVMRPELRRIQTRVRAHVSRVTNDLGALLESLGYDKEADSAYREALLLDNNNLCSSLNLFGLRMRNKAFGPLAELAEKLESLSSWPDFFSTFDLKVSAGGALAPQFKGTLTPAVLAGYMLAERPSGNMARLFERWLDACAKSPRKTASSGAFAQIAADGPPDMKLSQVVSMTLDGRSAEAEDLLRRLVRANPLNQSAWLVLAELLMRRGEFAEVESVILPAMRSTSAGSDSALINITQGRLYMRTDPPKYAEARACLARAWSAEPDLADVCAELLRADTMLGDAEALEADAQHILRLYPAHVEANSILGGLRMKQKRYGEAKRYLRHCFGDKPSPDDLKTIAAYLDAGPTRVMTEHMAGIAKPLKPLRGWMAEEQNSVFSVEASLEPEPIAVTRKQPLLGCITGRRFDLGD